MYWVTVAILLIYFVLIYLLPRWLPLHGSDVWILRGVLALLGLIGAAVAFWYQYKMKKAAEAAGEDGSHPSASDDLDGLVREAIRRLKQSTLGRGSNLGSLPLVYVLGDSGSTKTTVLIHSALDPELLAGQVYRDSDVLPTSSANLWYTRQAIFVDPAGAMMAQADRWKKLVKLLQPARFSAAFGKKTQAPRAAIVCFDCEMFLQPGASETAVSIARRLSTRLQEVSQLLGISFPVYVLFSKLDRISFFTEFVRGMSKDEVAEVLGATLPLRSVSAGVYADEETRRLTKAFDEIFYSLADRRIVLLPRENDSDKLPAIYEFPREIKKLRTLLVQFLVDLARPSQLGTNPFLRGFYFTGVRPIVLDDVVAAPIAALEAQEENSGGEGATQIFRSVGSQAAEAPVAVRSVGPRRLPQWCFLTALFNDVLVKDRVALAASGSSSHVNLLRRITLGTAVFLVLLCLTGFTISFFRNRGLQSRVHDDIEALKTVQTSPNQSANIDDLRKLDDLRGELVNLSDWEINGAPWLMRLGLYQGHDVYEDAMPFYFDRFNRILFADTQKRIADNMLVLPDTPPTNVVSDPQSSELYNKSYNELKAYLITSSTTPNKCYDQSKVRFLTQVLTNHWAAPERGIDKDRQALAARQFDFYATELVQKNWLGSGSSATLISHTRGYLKGFVGINLLYLRLKGSVPDAAARSFNERYDKSAEVIDSEHRVQGAFTRQGYVAVQNALMHPSDIGADECVMGSADALGLDPITVQHQLTQMYNDEFLKEWNTVLKTSRFTGYKGWADADLKLQKLTGPASPQMELLYFISHNVNAAPADLKAPFKAVQQVEDPAPTDNDTPPDKYLGPATSKYIDALVGLEVAVHGIAQSIGTPDPALVSQASTAEQSALGAATTIGSSLPLDHTQTPGNEQQVSRLLQEPIKDIEELIRMGPVAAANAAAKSFCSQFQAATQNKFPFNSNALQEVSIDQLNALFGDGFKVFADSEKQFVLKSGNQYVANPMAPVRPSAAFLQSLTTFSRLNDTLYSQGSTSPHLSYTLKVLPSNLEGVELKIGDKRLVGTGSQETFVWTGAPDSISVERSGQPVDTVLPGPWAVFRFISHAKHITPSDWQWVIENNGRVVMLTPTKQESYDYQLQVSGAANPFLEFPGMRCVGKVSQ